MLAGLELALQFSPKVLDARLDYQPSKAGNYYKAKELQKDLCS